MSQFVSEVGMVPGGPMASVDAASHSAPQYSADPAMDGIADGQASLRVAGVEDIPASAEMLHYYRSRIEEFEAERQLFLSKFGEVQASHEDMHRLRWEMRVRQDEIRDLQKALSDANVFLVDEREQVARLHSENEQLKVQELDDRRRIAHLLALTKPVSQEVTFFRDCRPGKMTRYPLDSRGREEVSAVGGPGNGSDGTGGIVDASAGRRVGRGVREAHAEGKRGGGGGGGAEDQLSVVDHQSGPRGGRGNRISRGGAQKKAQSQNRVLRTVYLPSEKADTLVMTVEALRKELSSVKELAGVRNKALHDDRRQRADEEELRATADKEGIVTLQEKLSSANEQSAANMKEVRQRGQRAGGGERDGRGEEEVARAFVVC